MHRLICILLLICLPLQSFAMQGGLLAAASAGQGMAHSLAHAEEIAHHHEHDGSVHYDDSAESVQHLQDHSSSSQAAYPTAPFQPAVQAQLAGAAGDHVAFHIPDPFLGSALRPPAPAPG